LGDLCNQFNTFYTPVWTKKASSTPKRQ
jgi:hypothetical protein